MATFKSSKDWFNARMKKPLEDLKKKNLPLVSAANSTHALMSQRVFDRGENTKGETFQYASQSYREKKRKFGRGTGTQTSFVNFTFTQDLKFDFANGISKLLNNDTVIVQVKREGNDEKVAKLNARFGGVTGSLFDPNDKEKENFVKVAELEFRRLFS